MDDNMTSQPRTTRLSIVINQHLEADDPDVIAALVRDKFSELGEIQCEPCEITRGAPSGPYPSGYIKVLYEAEVLPDRFAELRRAAGAATPGPWTVTVGREWQAEDDDPVMVEVAVKSPALGEWHEVVEWHPDENVVARPNDVAYLAAVSPDVVLDLLAELDRVAAERDALITSIAELAPSDEVEIDGNIFERAELPLVLRNVMRHLDDSRRESKAMYIGREDARAALARVKALHREEPIYEPCPDDGCENPACFEAIDGIYVHSDERVGATCAGCGVDTYEEPVTWPCPTIRALEGKNDE